MLNLSVLSDSATPWTVACHAPLSMGSSRQEYWSGLPSPPSSRRSSQARDRTQVLHIVGTSPHPGASASVVVAGLL